MGETHHRHYEELAVAHVLGGLPAEDASDFRNHLLSCRDCRRRVAELRDIAADLEQTARAERRRLAVAEADPPEEPEPRRLRPLSSARAGMLLVIGGVLLVTAVLLWNFHLRRVVTEYEGTLAHQSEVVDLLTGGEELEVDSGHEVVAARDDGRVAVSIQGLRRLADREVVVAWLLAGDDLEDQRVVADDVAAAEHPTIAFLVDAGEADRLVVTVEDASRGRPRTPGPSVVASVELDSR